MQVLRKFSVIVTTAGTNRVEGNYLVNKPYPVLGLDTDRDDQVFLLLADEGGILHWESWNEVMVDQIGN